MVRLAAFAAWTRPGLVTTDKRCFKLTCLYQVRVFSRLHKQVCQQGHETRNTEICLPRVSAVQCKLGNSADNEGLIECLRMSTYYVIYAFRFIF